MVWIPAPGPRRTVEETTTPELDPATRCSTMQGIVATRAFSKFLVVFLALTHGVRSLGRRARNSDPRRILVVHHLLLGDTLMLTPLLAKLRELFPRAYLTMTPPVPFV